MIDNEKLIANPKVVFRDDFDDYAILFNPETGLAFGVNPVGALIWKLLHNEVDIMDLTHQITEACSDIPSDVEYQVREFVMTMLEQGLVGTRLET